MYKLGANHLILHCLPSGVSSINLHKIWQVTSYFRHLYLRRSGNKILIDKDLLSQIFDV